ncbi:MAG: hypothetical protein FJW98_02340 [Actinobacteria bacterium]|nr:hypothetical protein [Actinomycetota bacterium]
MTIQKGEEWGRRSQAESVVTVLRDCDLAEMVKRASEHSSSIQVQAGDTWLALGRPHEISPPCETWDLTFDAIHVSAGPLQHTCFSSIVLRRSWWRGGFLVGPVWCVSLTGMLRGRNITPRAHANDGVIDVLHVSDTMNIRQRFQAWSRASRGDHLPHRGLFVTRTPFVDIASATNLLLIVDGVRRGNVRNLRVEVVPDAWRVSVPRDVSADKGPSGRADTNP